MCLNSRQDSHIVLVMGAYLNEGVKALLHSVEDTQLDSVLQKRGDTSLHLRELRNIGGDLFASEHFGCRCGNTKLGPKELGSIVIDGTI